MTVLISIIVFVVAVNIISKHTTVFFEEIIETTYLVCIISNLVAIFFKINTFTVNSCPTKYLASILAKISIFFRKVIACFMEFIYEHSTSIFIEEIVLSIKQKLFSFGLFSSWIKVVFLMINNLKSSGYLSIFFNISPITIFILNKLSRFIHSYITILVNDITNTIKFKCSVSPHSSAVFIEIMCLTVNLDKSSLSLFALFIKV